MYERWTLLIKIPWARDWGTFPCPHPLTLGTFVGTLGWAEEGGEFWNFEPAKVERRGMMKTVSAARLA